jgi:D-beta-D-heptose 7-phosphate kinase / D-beta-D-heptose 1-phosphate adenosyltransferase
MTPMQPTLFAALNDILDHLGDARVLVVGDVMLDRFIYGDVNRISPEGPVPVLSVTRENRMMGGAGNVVANLASLGAQAFITAVIGDDGLGRQLRDMGRDLKIDTDGLIIDTDRPTTVKTRFIASNQQMLRADDEVSAAITPATEQKILAYIDSVLHKINVVVLSDYRKGLLTTNLITSVIARAKAKNIKVIADPKGSDFSVYRGAYLVTPNRKELMDASRGMPCKSDNDVVLAATHVLEQSGVQSMLATRSQDGMTLIERNDAASPVLPPVHLRTQVLEVFDVSGAGDTVVATVAAALSVGANLENAARLANIAGGVVVAKVGTAAIRTDELRDRLLSGATGGGDAHAGIIFTWPQARDQIARWQAKGRIVGFTNGCFDILHIGHVQYLQQARAQCDHLIVGLNCDASIKRLKGEARPYNNETSRAAVMAALSVVDAVVLFGMDTSEQDTPSKVIGTLQPDRFFKGGDYTIATLPEAKVVQAYGGTITILPLVDGYSTTATLKRMDGKSAA